MNHRIKKTTYRGLNKAFNTRLIEETELTAEDQSVK